MGRRGFFAAGTDFSSLKKETYHGNEEEDSLDLGGAAQPERVLPAAATDYQVSDYLPLAVGNSWTYEHEYYDNTLAAASPNIPRITDPGELAPDSRFTSVLNTEVIDGKTYYVISDMPANWPPAPPHFIAGQEATLGRYHLMERTA